MSVLTIHGGCGVLDPSELAEAEWAEARDHLAQALRAGWSVLRQGGRALDAVEASVVALEDSPHFNAGHGAALNAEGEHELDASIMDGATLAAGAVCAAQRIRNPVRAARAVLESGKLALLAGPAADRFAEARGLAVVEPGYFTTERRLQSLDAMIRRGEDGTLASASEAEKHGTVGAVALDAQGHLAAATSTGGYTNKPPGRVGDSPIIGAGTYARDGVCAVSGTGQGEYFIRHVLGHEVASRVAYLGETLAEATTGVLADLKPYGIGAGLIAVDARGHVAAPFNTGGMFRGWVTAGGEAIVGTHGALVRVDIR
ncbi:MAG TPA: isoaspartyl peptidase/L-asparaginase [Lichenihabitans sp.]|jgi:beta-aspartyl-peptidase (threonine type)|nr:isoaspartyl peptidase/L-asparaginase [Lichenihabitans sp.]